MNKLTLSVQTSHIALSVIWNITGLLQIQNGYQSIGPTASISTIIILGFLLLLLIISANKSWRVVYIVTSLVLALGALSAIYGGFTKDVSLWPSAFWRYAGIAVNMVGVLGFLMALFSIRQVSKGFRSHTLLGV